MSYNIPYVSLVNVAVEESKKSTYKIRMGAVIFNKKRIIAIGHNHTNSMSRKLRPEFQEWPESIHAEIETILKAKTDLRGCDMLVLRVNNSNCFRMSKPCGFCMAMISRVGIKNVYYSNDEGMIEKIKVPRCK